MKVKELFEVEKMSDEKFLIMEKIYKWRQKLKAKNSDTIFGKFKVIPYNGGYAVEHLSKKLVIHEWMFENGELPFKFASCEKLEVVGGNAMRTFKNFPDKIINSNDDSYPGAFSMGDSIFTAAVNLTSLEGCPSYINGAVTFAYCRNLSFSNADKHIKFAKKIILPFAYKGPILSLLRIEGLESTGITQDLQFKILNKHLQGDRDILDCQEELIDAGFKEYAKL